MSKESYARGFCKAAESAGVDPVALAKYAQQTIRGIKPGPNKVNAAVQNAYNAAKNEGIGMLKKYVRPITPLTHPAIQDEMNRRLVLDGARSIGSLVRSGGVDVEAIRRDFVPGYDQRMPDWAQRIKSMLSNPLKVLGNPLGPSRLNKALRFYGGK